MRARLPLATIWRVASIPSRFGIRTSIKITSGSVSRASAMACRPSSASPATSSPARASMIMRNPLRTRDWSSQIRTRVVMAVVLAVAGEAGVHLESALRARRGGQAAAVERVALAHADDPAARVRAAVGGRPGWEAVVEDVDGELFGVDGQGHLGRGRPGVLKGVGEGFLDDAVGGGVDPGGQVLGGPSGAHGHCQAGAADLADQGIELGEPGLRGRRSGLAGWADRSEYPAQFGQGLPPGGLDRAEGVAGLVRA